jgi:hypothetical protein
MPKRGPIGRQRPPPIQLPLFAETASPVRLRPARSESRFYRIEVWPDLFGRALLARCWGRIGPPSRRRRQWLPGRPGQTQPRKSPGARLRHHSQQSCVDLRQNASPR